MANQWLSRFFCLGPKAQGMEIEPVQQEWGMNHDEFMAGVQPISNDPTFVGS
jgi:hypothetical protein